MAKTIKFNLDCGGESIRTLEDLQNHFQIEDVINYYHDGLLQRWLKVHDYDDELKAVNAITEVEPEKLVNQLQKALGLNLPEEEVRESCAIYSYKSKREALQKVYAEGEIKTQQVLDDYLKGYNEALYVLFQPDSDSNAIKAAIQEIADHYQMLFDKDFSRVFRLLDKHNALAHMRLLMNPYTRKFYVPEGEMDQVLESDHDRKILYNSFCGLSRGTDFIHDLGESVKTYKDQTDSYWYDLEAKGKKYMVISMGSGDMVRPAGNRDVKYTYADIKEKFLILDGIDYMSNNVCTQIVYMEV